MRNCDFGLQPASNHATSSSRVSIGVMSIWSRAIRGFRRKGPRPYTGAAREGNWVKGRARLCARSVKITTLADVPEFSPNGRKPAQRPPPASCRGARADVFFWSDPSEVLRLDHFAQSVEFAVDAVPARQLLHIGEPALDVGIGRKIATDELAERDDAGPEIVGDGDLVTAQILLRADPMIVEQLEPVLGVVLRPLDGGGLGLVAAPFMVRKKLRIGKAVAPVAIEVAVDPVHHLVDLGALLQILRVGRRADLVGEIFQDSRAFGELEIAVDQHRHQPVRVDRRVWLL